MRLWPRRAGGQLALLLIGVLLLGQIITVWILAGERQGALRSVGLEHVLQRVADAYSLLDTTSLERREQLLRVLSSPNLTLSIDPAPDVDAADGSNELSHNLTRTLGIPRNRVRSEMTREGEHCRADTEYDEEYGHHEDEHDEHDDDREEHHERTQRCPPQLRLSMGLASGEWLNARAVPSRPSWLWLRATLTSVAITAGLLTLTVLVAIRRILRPVNALSDAAYAFGRGEKKILEERGPADVRQVTRAFNRMQEQVSRAHKDREHLLAALAHDLRTPITSMRLRVEMLPDGEDRDRLLASLEEMQHLAEATLDFIRGSAQEAHQRYDLATLLSSLCDDLTELGMAVDCEDAPRCVLQGQPAATRRALRNLIENAVRYGDQARVHLETTDEQAIVTVTDSGPGIAAEQRDKVFQPFYRVEGSRSRDTGGAGLGLAIARTLIRHMGGDIELGDGPGGRGLSVRVKLPRIVHGE